MSTEADDTRGWRSDAASIRTWEGSVIALDPKAALIFSFIWNIQD